MTRPPTRFHNSRRAATALLVVAVAASLLPFALPATADGDFADVGQNPHRAAIDYLAGRGVTSGCNPPANDRFCPGRFLTRGEMATFLVRAFDLSPSDTDRFSDDASSVHEADINALAKARVTLGCNPPDNTRFCPNARVTRGEMSAFINRILNLDGGSDRFSDLSSSVFESDINAVTRVGISRGCNPPGNTSFCPNRPISRAEMATFLMRSMEIARTGTTTTTTGGTTDPPAALPNACRALSDVPQGPADPTGDVVIQPGTDIQGVVNSRPAGTRFIIAAGVHHNQRVTPRNGDQFVGRPGAILDGGGTTEYAFGGPGDSALIEGLEIRNYNSPTNQGKGVIRSVGGARNWTIRANEIHHNMGAAIATANGFKILGNHLHHNQEYGVAGQGKNIVIEGNVISHNNRHGTRQDPHFGAGGTKFAQTDNLVLRNNCSHDNDGPGLWTDGGNINVLFEGNTLVDNTHAGIKHEVSCRATIRGNTAIGNGSAIPWWVEGGGILVMNSRDVTITGNIVRDNNGGIGAVWFPRQNQKHSNCQWELRNLQVEGNRIEMTRGETGIARGNAGNEVYNSWNNKFRNNEYVLSPGNARFFRWGDTTIDLNGWKAAGQG